MNHRNILFTMEALFIAAALLLSACDARKPAAQQAQSRRGQTTSTAQHKPAVKNGLPAVDYADMPKLKADKLPTDKSGQRIVAMVNDRPITERRFRAELRTAMSRQSPTSEEQTQAYEGALAAPVMDNLISTALILEYASKNRLVVSDEEIDRLITKSDARLPNGNKLSDDAIRKGLSREEMHDSIRERLLTKKVEDHIGRTQSPATDEELAVFSLNHPEITTNTSEIHVSHIVIRAHDTATTAQVEAARAKAQSVLDKITSGLDFAEAARRFSEDAMTALQGGDLGWCAKGTMYPAFDTAAFSASVGETTGVIHTPVGFHIIHVTGRQQGNAQSLYMTVQRKKAFLNWMQDARKNARIEKFL